jgi:RNA polymerase sigma-70 factor (ECF subfamily)
MVFGLALRILGERATAEEAVVEVFAQVWAQAGSYDPRRGTPLAWVLTIARSRALDLLRSRHRSQHTEPLEAADHIPATSPTPEEASEALRRHRMIRQALEDLRADQRQVIELAYFTDLSHREIADKLGLPLGTVKTRIRQGMMQLRAALTPLAPPSPLLPKEHPL